MNFILTKSIRGKGSRNGLTLVEVMVGVLIIGLVVVGWLLALPQLRKTVIKGEQAQMAAMVINSQMEEFRTMQFDAVRMWTPAAVPDVVTVNDFEFTRTVTITPIALNGVNDEAVEVLVTLNWTLQGQDQSSSSWTVFTKEGLSDKYYSDASY